MDKELNNRYIYLFMVVAYVFSVALRMIWLNDFSSYEQFNWYNQLMINTNDGYYWAEGARDILNGFHQPNDLSPIDYPLSKLTAFLAKIVPISFETLILWMPTIFGSLLVVPIILIGRVFKEDLVGFIAGLLGSIAWSYYNRTMMGYYDTDMLVVVLPTFMIWAVLFTLKNKSQQYLFLAPIFAVFSIYWHGGLLNIVNLTLFITFLYTIIFERKNLFYYKFLIVFILSLVTLPVWIKVGLVFLFSFGMVFFKEKLTEKSIVYIAILSILIYLIFGGFEWMVGVLSNAYFTRALHADDLNLSLHYYGVINTVREAGHIPFEIFADRISGSITVFILSIIGYILFIYKHRLFVLSFPMVILGFFAIQGGLRFTVFAVPFMALGVAYLIVFIANYISQKKVKYAFILFATLVIIYPNIKHIQKYKVPTVFVKDEVKVLDKLKSIAKREDYVVSWWDYGYPIRYYSDVKTLVDGGKHSGDVNFPVSFSLLYPQTPSSNMSRLAVEFTEKSYQDKEYKGKALLDSMLKFYNYKNPNKFISLLEDEDFKLPKKTRDIYLYLPNRMMGILPTIDLFSNIDLLNGNKKYNTFFYQSKNFQESPTMLNLGNNIILDKKRSIIRIRQNQIPLNSITITEYDKNGKLHLSKRELYPQSNMYMIIMRNYHQILLMDNRVFNSTYIQLFVLENYDKNIFEPVILTPLAKVYRLKK